MAGMITAVVQFNSYNENEQHLLTLDSTRVRESFDTTRLMTMASMITAVIEARTETNLRDRNKSEDDTITMTVILDEHEQGQRQPRSSNITKLYVCCSKQGINESYHTR